MIEYQNLVRRILDAGEDVPDRTGTGTRSIFGHQMRFDLARGFPLVTTKRTFFRGAFEEMLWMLRGETNEAWLSQRGVNIWREWMDSHHQLFDIYGKQMRRFEAPSPQVELVKLRPRCDGSPEGVVRRFELIDPAAVEQAAQTGAIRSTNKCGKVRLLDRINGKYRAQFLDSGFVTNLARPSNACVHDPYRPSYAGVGYIGEPHRPYSNAEINLWRGIIKRCYLPTSTTYQSYGAKGCTVARRWHCFASFLEDISTIPGYESWLRSPGEHHLDKDYYGANQYGPGLCVFLRASQNGALTGTAVEVDGGLYLSMREAEKETGRSRKTLHTNVADAPEGYAYRRVFFVDQLQSLIDGLRDNPHSRRHVINLWNPADVERAALPACHALVQFHVSRSGRLSCQLYQRSADVFLGVPFNLAGYALLTHLLAHHLGYDPGEFVWTGGDCHLYTNHLDKAEKLLGRNPLPLPNLVMTHAPDTPIWEVTTDTLHLVGYDPHPAIPAEVSV